MVAVVRPVLYDFVTSPITQQSSKEGGTMKKAFSAPVLRTEAALAVLTLTVTPVSGGDIP